MIKCTIEGNPDWGKLQKVFEEQVSKDIIEGKLDLNFMNKREGKIDEPVKIFKRGA